MSARNRVVAAAGLLVALFVVGAVWLAVRATGTAPQPTVLDPVAQASTSESPAAPAAPAETGGGPASTAATGGGEDPPRPPRIARVAGAQLNGDLDGTCVLLIYENAAAKYWVLDIALKSDLPGLSRDDRRGCSGTPGGQLCQGFAFAPDTQTCNVGLAIPADTPPGTYTVTVELTLRLRCTSTEPAQCRDVGRPAPTKAQPVDAVFVGALSVEKTIDEPAPEPKPEPEPPSEEPGPTGEPSDSGSPSVEPTT